MLERDYIYFDSQNDEIHDLSGVAMNTKYIFFWNDGKVWVMLLENKVIKVLDLYISLKETHTKITKIRTGSDENTICVRVD